MGRGSFRGKLVAISSVHPVLIAVISTVVIRSNIVMARSLQTTIVIFCVLHPAIAIQPVRGTPGGFSSGSLIII